VTAKRVIEGGYEIVRARLPALLTITNANYEPRGLRLRGFSEL